MKVKGELYNARGVFDTIILSGSNEIKEWAKNRPFNNYGLLISSTYDDNLPDEKMAQYMVKNNRFYKI